MKKFVLFSSEESNLPVEQVAPTDEALVKVLTEARSKHPAYGGNDPALFSLSFNLISGSVTCCQLPEMCLDPLSTLFQQKKRKRKTTR